MERRNPKRSISTAIASETVKRAAATIKTLGTLSVAPSGRDTKTCCNEDNKPVHQSAKLAEPAAKATPAYVNIDLKTEERDKIGLGLKRLTGLVCQGLLLSNKSTKIIHSRADYCYLKMPVFRGILA